MSIRFKFRSSVNFDSINIDGKPAISVGELKSKIVLQKHLNICQDFDLVFSDALTGQEYNDEKFLIPSDSSVIIKRVPAEPKPSAQLRDQKLEASDLSEAIPKDSTHSRGEETIPQPKHGSEFEERLKVEKASIADLLDMQSAGLPSELKCSLCNNFFKEAVMIPCCQHSFCKKCISQVLIAKARCPKCSSINCRLEDLLPNISLRHAIEHFLESQILTTGPDDGLREYAPDGESGIHAKEVSCAITVTERNPHLLSSSSAMEKGSNQNITESFYESLDRTNAALGGSGYHAGNLNKVGVFKSAPSLFRVKHVAEERGREDWADAVDSQGENQPISLPQAHVTDEADSNIRRKRSWVDPGGGGQSFVASGRSKKVDRTCYMCGSPGHFIRDCPAASTPHLICQTGDPMFQGGMHGYAMPYWSGTAFPPARPYMNMYGNPAMMAFNVNMVPVSPYAVPQYVPPVYGGLPVPSGSMRTGALAPHVRSRGEQPINHSEYLDIRDGFYNRKLPNQQREHNFDHEDDDTHKRRHYHELERSTDYKSHTEREKSESNSDDNQCRKQQRRHHHGKHLDHYTQSTDERSHSAAAGRDQRSYHSGPNSGVEDVPSSTDRLEVRHKQHYRSSTKHREKRDHSSSECSGSRHQIIKERHVKRRVESDVRDFQHKQKSRSSSGADPYTSEYQKKRSKDFENAHGLRESSNRTKPTSKDLCGDRWRMANGSDKECIEGYRHRKRRRGL